MFEYSGKNQKQREEETNTRSSFFGDFMCDIDYLISKKVDVACYIKQIIEDKVVMKPKFTSKGSNGIIVTFHGINDAVMSEWGNKCGLPRGFHMLWVPKTSLSIHGFYPKFGNDDLGISVIDSESFSDAQKMSGNKKYSGSLGIIFSLNPTEYIVCTKNSLDDDFTDQMSGLISNDIHPELVKFMYEHNINICCEMMLPRDKVHGSNHVPGYVLTCVARGQKFIFNKDLDIVDRSGYVPTQKDTCKFLNYLTNYDVMKFAMDHKIIIGDIEYIVPHNLKVSDMFEIEGSTNIVRFLQRLELQRNAMHASMFDQIAAECGCKIIEGSLRHQAICGEILEGLVLKIATSTTNKTVKYKFPCYTFRTMFLREFINEFLSSSENKRSMIVREITDSDKFKFVSKFERWAKRWLVHDDTTEHYWRFIGHKVFIHFTPLEI